MRKKDDMLIVKYTLMPLNEEDNYENFFSLSLREFAKSTKDKVLLAPLIVYNSELDVPMDNDFEEYTIYCNNEQILDVIKKYEIEEGFRTLILHGFDISIDELRDIYIGICRKNSADLCINIIEDTGIDSNITLYIDPSIEHSSEELWAKQKEELTSEIVNFINSYDDKNYFDYEDIDTQDVEDFLTTLFSEYDNIVSNNKEKKSNKKEKETKSNLPSNVTPIDIPYQEEKEEKVIGFSFENNNDIVRIDCIDNEMFVIQENEYEIILNKMQMEFLAESYQKIIKILESEEPRK